MKLIILTIALLFVAACGVAETETGRTIYHISFDDIAPEGYTLTQSWDAMGIGTDDTVYIGFTAFRPDGLEDFVLFSYNHFSGERNFLGTFMQAAAAAGNLHPGEEMPKGHTKLVYVDGMLYMTSQSFHDFKGPLDGLENYRGAHLFRFDTNTGEFTNLSANMPGGVVLEHEGIIALSHMPSAGYLVGLSHPHSNIVFICQQTYEVARIVEGIPWQPGLVVSRDLVVDDINQRVYIYRGPENVMPEGTMYTRFSATNFFQVYMYDLQTDTFGMTNSQVSGGMWGQALVTADGRTAYVSTVGGLLVEIDFDTTRSRVFGSLQPREFMRYHTIHFLYHITFNEDETAIYTIPTYAGPASGLYRFCLETRQSEMVMALPHRVYTGNGIRDSHGNMYFAAFGWHDFAGDCYLMIIAP